MPPTLAVATAMTMATALGTAGSRLYAADSRRGWLRALAYAKGLLPSEVTRA